MLHEDVWAAGTKPDVSSSGRAASVAEASGWVRETGMQGPRLLTVSQQNSASIFLMSSLSIGAPEPPVHTSGRGFRLPPQMPVRKPPGKEDLHDAFPSRGGCDCTECLGDEEVLAILPKGSRGGLK